MGAIVMVADIVELSIGIEEVAADIVGQRRTGIETDTDTTVEGRISRRGYAHILVVPLIPLFVGDSIVLEYRILHHFLYVSSIAICLELIN